MTLGELSRNMNCLGMRDLHVRRVVMHGATAWMAEVTLIDSGAKVASWDGSMPSAVAGMCSQVSILRYPGLVDDEATK